MTDLKNIVKVAGLAITVVGAILAYANSPTNTSVIDGGNAFTDHAALERQATRKSLAARVGVGMTLIGALIQFGGDCIPTGV